MVAHGHTVVGAMTANRCTGHCCRSFCLPLSPKELREAYERWRASLDGHPIYKNEEPKDKRIYNDIWLVAPMAKHIGIKQTFQQVNPPDHELTEGKKLPGHWYRCKHFDDKTKKCSIYEIRPRMCRDYPYGESCNYAGCTWKKVKAKKETRAGRAARKKGLLADRKKLKDPGGKKV